jgi:hypothetical protein
VIASAQLRRFSAKAAYASPKVDTVLRCFVRWAFLLGRFPNVAEHRTRVFVLHGMAWQFVVERTQEKLPFVPYHVFITPKFHSIATDFDLVKDSDEEWAKLREAIQKLPKEPWNIWDSGFSFSVITPELIFQHGWNRFTTELDMSASLAPVAFARKSYTAFSPRLELHAWADGYRVKLVLQEDHWDRIKNKPIFAKMDKHDADDDHMCGTVEIVLAVIPQEGLYVHFSVKPGDSLKGYRAAVRAEARARYGWKGEAQTDMYERERLKPRRTQVFHSLAFWHLTALI